MLRTIRRLTWRVSMTIRRVQRSLLPVRTGRVTRNFGGLGHAPSRGQNEFAGRRRNCTRKFCEKFRRCGSSTARTMSALPQARASGLKTRQIEDIDEHNRRIHRRASSQRRRARARWRLASRTMKAGRCLVDPNAAGNDGSRIDAVFRRVVGAAPHWVKKRTREPTLPGRRNS